MMEKSSEVVLSKEERDIIQGRKSMTKSAGRKAEGVPERFVGWYSKEELKEIANGQD